MSFFQMKIVLPRTSKKHRTDDFIGIIVMWPIVQYEIFALFT